MVDGGSAIVDVENAALQSKSLILEKGKANKDPRSCLEIRIRLNLGLQESY